MGIGVPSLPPLNVQSLPRTIPCPLLPLSLLPVLLWLFCLLQAPQRLNLPAPFALSKALAVSRVCSASGLHQQPAEAAWGCALQGVLTQLTSNPS